MWLRRAVTQSCGGAQAHGEGARAASPLCVNTASRAGLQVPPRPPPDPRTPSGSLLSVMKGKNTPHLDPTVWA